MDLANKKPLLGLVGVVFVAVAAWLAFGFFGIHTAFIDNEVDESADNLFDTVESTDAVAAEDPSAEPAVPEALAEEAPIDQARAEPIEEEPVEGTTEEPVDEGVAEAPVEEVVAEAPTEEPPVEPVDDEPAPTEEEVVEQASTPGEIVTIARGNFVGTNDYSVVGDALVLNNGSEQRFLRFENFTSDNGPDLKVYLRAASGEFLSLGDLSGNIGDQNYEIPVDVDLSVFRNVEIWCERFGAGFGVATLQ